MKHFRSFTPLVEQSASDLTFGKPDSDQSRIMDKPHGILPVDPSEALVDPPPANGSAKTRSELETLQERLATSENSQELMEKWDEDLLIPFIEYLKENDLPVEKRSLEEIINASTVILLKQKYLFNRPRPAQLAKVLDMDLKPLGAKTANSPAYPSGHSTQSRLIALYLTSLHRDHGKSFMELAEECGQSRLNAAVHYPSDHTAGKDLANKLFVSMKTRNELATLKYRDLPAPPGGMEGY